MPQDVGQDFHLPELGEGVYEAEFVRWLVNVGDVVKGGQNLLEVMTDKATMEVPAPFAGTVTELRAEPGQKLKVGDVVLTYTPAGSGQPAPVPAATVSAAPAEERRDGIAEKSGNGAAPASRLGVKAAPSVRLLARKLGIDLAAVRGSGPDGRVLVDDLTSAIGERPSAVGPKADGRKPIADFGTPGTRVKLHGLRRKIAEHMVHSKRTVPHYSYVDECDVSELVKMRQSLREHFARQGVKLTYLAFVVKAAAAALKDIPLVNASLDDEAEEIVLHDRYNVGVAVATPAGLIVPVVHDADRKDVGAIAREVEQLSAAARAGKIRREEVRGGTFTVTSVGNLGGLISTPVINHPEVGILGIGKVVRRPVFDDKGHVVPADIVHLSFSFDHRVVDGAVGAVFANAVIHHLQNPALLLLSP